MVDQKLRQIAIGGSEIAAVMGFDERRDAFAIWAQKKGDLTRGPATNRMQLGKYFEEGIIRYYEDLTGRETKFDDVTRAHPSKPWVVCTPDALCVHERRGVDAKLVQFDQRYKWGTGPDEVPARIAMQAHWYMAAMDYPVWDVVAIIGDEARIYNFERDLEIEEAMDAAAEEFWRRYLIGDERPPIGHTEEATRWVKEQFPWHRPAVRVAAPHEAELLDRYAEVRARDKETTNLRTALENELKLAVGEDAGLQWERGRFTWKQTKDTLKTDWEALSSSLMKSMAVDERLTLINEFSASKPGVRRIWFSSDSGGDQ